MKNKGIIKLIIIIVIILVVIFLGFILYNKLKNSNEEKKNISTKEDFKKINDITSSIPYSNETMGFYKDAYSQDNTLLNDVLSLAIASSTFEKDNTIKEEDMSKINSLLKEKKLEGETVYTEKFINEELTRKYDMILDSYEIPNDIKVNKLGNQYVVIKYNRADVLKQSKVLIQMIKYELNGQMIIKEKALFVVLKEDKYYVYPNSDIHSNQAPLKTYNYDNKSIFEIKELIKKDFKEYKTEFMHTFRKNELGYYWYSTEIVNEY